MVNLINKGVGRSNANLVDNVGDDSLKFLPPKTSPATAPSRSLGIPSKDFLFHPSLPESFLPHRRPQRETPLRVRLAAVGMQLYNSSGDSSAFYQSLLEVQTSGSPAGHYNLVNILAHSCRLRSASVVCIALQESSPQLTPP